MPRRSPTKLTDKLVVGTGCDHDDPAKSVWQSDTEVPGFGVRVFGNDRRVFYLRYRDTERRVRWYQIGRYANGSRTIPDSLSLDQARTEALRVKVRIAEGENPAEARPGPKNRRRVKRRRRRKRDPGAGQYPPQTLGHLLHAWLHDYAKQNRKGWKQDSYYIGDLPDELMREPLATLEPIQLRRWYEWKADKAPKKYRNGEGEREQGSPVAANRTVQVIRSAWNWAELEDQDRPHSPDAWLIPRGAINPTRSVLSKKRKIKRREQARSRWLTLDEVSTLIDAVDELAADAARWPYYEPFPYLIRLYLLTGFRRDELLTLEWEHVDLSTPALHLPTTKTGPATRVISNAAASVLSARPRGEEDRYVFPSTHEGVGGQQPLRSPKTTWATIRERAGLSDIWLHDLRRTMARHLRDLGHSTLTIKDALGHHVSEGGDAVERTHRPRDVTEHAYSPARLESIRSALNDLASHYAAVIRMDRILDDG